MNWQTLAEEIINKTADVFGEVVTYIPLDEPSFQIIGIFDAAHQEVEPQTGVVIHSVQPKISVKLSDFPSQPTEDDRILIRGSEYRVTEFHPDGHGAAMLMLHKTNDYK